MKLNKSRDFGKTGIYCIKNKLNHKLYIGKAKCIYKRIKAHITALNTKNKDENRHLINSWHKYGRDNFEYFVLEYLEPNEQLLSERELYWQRFYKVIDKRFGYNLREDSSTGCFVSLETRLKQSVSGKKRFKKYPELSKKLSLAASKFWKDNPEKLREMISKVAESNRRYKIVKLDFNTLDILDTINSKEEFKLKYPEYYYQAVLGCCNGTKNSYRGFKWGYVELNTGILINNKPERKRNWTRRKSVLNYKIKEKVL